MLETGYRKPLSSLVMSDKESLKNTLKTHVLMRVKPEIDQFCEGLRMCGILETIRRYSTLMAPYFNYTPVNLTSGVCLVYVVSRLVVFMLNLFSLCRLFQEFV